MYGEYEPQVLEKLHNVELSMLKDFMKLCDDNNIEYFAISGTAIGAVRHHGFLFLGMMILMSRYCEKIMSAL